jgi:hypothetical protein
MPGVGGASPEKSPVRPLLTASITCLPPGR